MSQVVQDPQQVAGIAALDQGKRPRKSVWWLRIAIGVPLMALVWYFLVKGLAADFAKIHQQGGWKTIHVNWSFLAAALGALVAAKLMTAMNCRYVLGAIGQRLRHRQTVPIIWVASLGRYIPGKMAVVAGSVLMLTRLGVQWHLALAALFLSTALMILIALMSAVPLMFMPAMRQAIPYGWAASIVLLIGGLVCLHPRIFTRLCNLALTKLKRQPLPDRLELPSYFRAVGITLLRLFFLGVALWCAAAAFKWIGFGTFALALGAGGTASVAGFLAVFAPAGLGVHEFVYLATFGTLLGPQVALLVVIFRILNLLSDAITGAAGMAMLRLKGK